MTHLDVNLYFSGNYGPEEQIGAYPCWPSEYLRWVSEKTDYVIIVDDFDLIDSDHKYKFAVLMEPKSLTPKNYETVLINQHKFNLIFSPYLDYGNGGSKFKYYAGGARSFIRPEERQMYSKTHNIVSIASNKRFMLGHQLRHKLKNWNYTLGDARIDYINPPMNRKIDALHNYRFEVVIENEDATFFSEKLIDSMLAGCIPIYYTELDASYLNMFDLNGIVIARSIEEIQQLVLSDTLNEEYYNSRINAIQYNLEIAKQYSSFGDVIWNAGLGDYIKMLGGE
jgi:hypothetical protein